MEIVDLAAKLLPAVSIAVTAVFAVIGLNAWRRQMVGRRKFDVAEQALANYVSAMDALRSIRNPAIFSGEIGRRQIRANEIESDGVKSVRDSYHVTLMRVADRASIFAELRKSEVLCKLHFGDDVGKPFDVMFEAVGKIRVAAQMLFETAGEQRVTPDDMKRFQEWQWTVWFVKGDDDKIQNDVDTAYAALMGFLKGHLDS